MAARAGGDVGAHVVRAKRVPRVPVFPAEQCVQPVAAAEQVPDGGADRFVGDRDRPALALLGDVVEQDALAGHPHVPLFQRRGAVVMIQFGVPLSADAEEAEVDEPDRARGHAVLVEPAAFEVVHGGRPERGQGAGEPQHVRELLRVPLLAPGLVIAVLGAAPGVDAGGLDVPQRIR